MVPRADAVCHNVCFGGQGVSRRSIQNILLFSRTGLHFQFVRLQTKGHLLDEFWVRFEVGGGTIS
jgi:hypothetical protein